MTTMPPDHRADESVDPDLRPVVSLLESRAARLRQRPGLEDRVMVAVRAELELPAVAGRVGPAWDRRHAALAAVVALLLIGAIASILARSSPAPAPSSGGESLALADGSTAERMLVAILEELDAGDTSERIQIMEEFIPGSIVGLDDLDWEMQRIIEGGRRGGGVR